MIKISYFQRRGTYAEKPVVLRDLDPYLIRVCSVLMLGTIRSVAKSFTTAGKFTSVRLFASMRS